MLIILLLFVWIIRIKLKNLNVNIYFIFQCKALIKWSFIESYKNLKNTHFCLTFHSLWINLNSSLMGKNTCIFTISNSIYFYNNPPSQSIFLLSWSQLLNPRPLPQVIIIKDVPLNHHLPPGHHLPCPSILILLRFLIFSEHLNLTLCSGLRLDYSGNIGDYLLTLSFS